RLTEEDDHRLVAVVRELEPEAPALVVLLRHLFGLLPHARCHRSLLLLRVGGLAARLRSLAPVHGEERGSVGGLASLLEVEVHAGVDDLLDLPAAEEARQTHEIVVAGRAGDGRVVHVGGLLRAAEPRFGGQTRPAPLGWDSEVERCSRSRVSARWKRLRAASCESPRRWPASRWVSS